MASVDWSDTGVVARVRKELQADERALFQQHSIAHPPLVHNLTLTPSEFSQQVKTRCQNPSGKVSTAHISLLEKCFQNNQHPRGTGSSEKQFVTQRLQPSVFKEAKSVVGWSACEVQKTGERSDHVQKHDESYRERNGEQQLCMSQTLCCRPFTYGLGPPRKESFGRTVLDTTAKNQGLKGARCPPVKGFCYLSPKLDLTRMAHVQRNYLENIILLQSLFRRWLVRVQVKSECLHLTLSYTSIDFVCYS